MSIILTVTTLAKPDGNEQENMSKNMLLVFILLSLANLIIPIFSQFP